MFDDLRSTDRGYNRNPRPYNLFSRSLTSGFSQTFPGSLSFPKTKPQDFLFACCLSLCLLSVCQSQDNLNISGLVRIFVSFERSSSSFVSFFNFFFDCLLQAVWHPTSRFSCPGHVSGKSVCQLDESRKVRDTKKNKTKKKH